MKTTKIIVIVLLSFHLKLTLVRGDCQTSQDVWRELTTNNENDIEKLNNFFIQVGKDEQDLRRLRNAVRRYLENKNDEDFSNKINSLNIKESPKNCQNYTDEWRGMIENNQYDLKKLREFYDESKKVERSLYKLHVAIEEYLIKKNIELLLYNINTYSIEESPKKIFFLIDNISKNYTQRMISKIFSKLIEEVYKTNSYIEIPNVLWRLYQGDVISLEFMSMALIRAFLIPKTIDIEIEKQFQYQLAYRIYKVQQESLYEKLPQNVKNALQNSAEVLPKNLQYLFFKPHFCLENVKYSKFINTGIKTDVDQNNRLIWLSPNNSSLDKKDTRYFKADIRENNQDLKIALLSTKYQSYLIMEPKTKLITSLDSFSSASKYVWDVEFLLNDSVVFLQNNYLMCALETYDHDKQNIGGVMKNKTSYMNSECQWNLIDCSINLEEER